MANLHYLGKNGQAPEPTLWEQHKADGQQILNEIARTKLKKLNGHLLDRREVEFVIGNAIATLRGQILRLPLLIAAELRELDHDQLHAIRMRTERAVDSFLEEAAESLTKAVDPRAAIAELESEDDIGKTALKSLGQSKTLLLERNLAPTRGGARKEKASNKRMDNIDNDIAVHLDLAKLSKLIKRVERDGENIVHGWDDKRNVAWWKDAFKVLKPPPRDDSVD